jgi:lipopolysaccharide/colanic/teichoic acid biosynthesis glycosyltransferase
MASRPARLEDTLSTRYRRLAHESPRRATDSELRALDIFLSALLLLLVLPLAVLIAIVLTTGLPLLYRGERVGRSGRVFTMLKFRTLRRGAARRLGPFLGDELVRRTRREYTPDRAVAPRPADEADLLSGTRARDPGVLATAGRAPRPNRVRAGAAWF